MPVSGAFERQVDAIELMLPSDAVSGAAFRVLERLQCQRQQLWLAGRGKIERSYRRDAAEYFGMLGAKYLFEVGSGIAVSGSVPQNNDSARWRKRGSNVGIVAGLLTFALPAELALLPV
jgi:hypothetical protein